MQRPGLLLTLVGWGTTLITPSFARAQSSPSSAANTASTNTNPNATNGLASPAPRTVSCPTEPPWTSRSLVELIARRAVHRAGLNEPDPLHDVASRARWSALVPRVTVRVGRGLSYGLNTTTSTTTTDRESLGDSMHFEVGASFDLDRAAWSPIEIDAIRADAQRTERRRALEREVLETLTVLERDRVQRSQCVQPGTPNNSAHGTVSAEVIHARLRVEWWTGVEWQRLHSL